MCIVPEVEKDYSTACNPARPPKRKIQIEHWKYDLASPKDLPRSARNSFRVIALFLQPETEGTIRTLYFTHVIFKGDREDITEEEVKNAADELNAILAQREISDDDPEEAQQDSN